MDDHKKLPICFYWQQAGTQFLQMTMPTFRSLLQLDEIALRLPFCCPERVLWVGEFRVSFQGSFRSRGILGNQAAVDELHPNKEKTSKFGRTKYAHTHTHIESSNRREREGGKTGGGCLITMKLDMLRQEMGLI